MQKQLDEIKVELTKRIYDAFMAKFNGNQLRFAKAAGCDHKTISNLFDGSGMSVNLLFKLAAALEIEASELLKGLSVKSNE